MAENKILPWAQTGTANVLSDADYAADVATGGLYGDGVKTGQASSKQANKTWRQATAPGSGLGQFLVDNLGVDVTDADTPATFSTRIANAVLKLAQISPFNQSWATATGGYRKYAIVSDSSGNFWVSTADQNTTVPGASGANWRSLFDGYATQSWADGRYIRSPANPNTDARILTISRNKASGGIFAAADDGSNTQLQPAGDYATNTALQAETSRAKAEEALKANLAGGNSFTGQQNITGIYGSTTSGSECWAPTTSSIVQGRGGDPTVVNNPVSTGLYAVEKVGSAITARLQISGYGGRSDYNFYRAVGVDSASDGRLHMPAGVCATVSDIPGTFIKSASGKQVFPSGLMLVWDTVTIAANSTTAATATSIVFPFSFPSVCLGIIGTDIAAGVHVVSGTPTSVGGADMFSYNHGDGVTTTMIQYLAWGF